MATMTDNPASSADLLNAVYEQLAFDQGSLLSAMHGPNSGALEDWVDRGDWQSLAAQVGAERIFFVDRDPVIVFAKTDDASPDVLRTLYGRIWCMSRPQLLFLASPGQLSVFDLTKSPPKADEELGARDRLIETITTIAEVQSKLGAYHRECIESGTVFGDARFRNSANRSDRALIRDLKTVRQQLATIPGTRAVKRPELRHLHSLIGRAIFIRYLEDREILVPEYFESVAARRKEWTKLLSQAPTAPALEPRLTELLFLRVLQNKDFTYALFDQLAHDFNGDTFPIDEEERERIQQTHLDTLRGFLLGSTSAQESLFFFAYRFDIIPIELISTIYEEFYNERTGKDRNQGSHYTPPALVEFVLAHTLTPSVLATKPRVLDPACGSGIFLVESFRRIVRHHCGEQNGRRVSPPQLRKILRDQIAGMDINEEAVRVAAFSLYLAFLHYQKPREINEERRLPYLKWVSKEEREHREKQKPGAQFLDVLLHANSFEAIAEKLPAEVTQRFGPGTATVVVGNPPWGYPKKEDVEGHKAMANILDWCDAKKGRPIGDKELSQAFIHLTQALLQDGGRAGLLVSSGVFFKHHQNSRDFRRVWLGSALLEHVVNFAHVRQIFFSGPLREARGISPFASVVFEKTRPGSVTDSHFQYWSAKRTAIIENTQCVVLNRGDMHLLSQRDCLADERLWKIYWWGGHRDEALVRRLETFPRLGQLSKVVPNASVICRQGFTESKQERKPSPAWFLKYKELPAEELVSYGSLQSSWLVPVPKNVKRAGSESVYKGTRLLVGRGVGQATITARLETEPFAFRNSVNAFRLEGLEPWQEKTLLGICWSSIAKYYFFTTIGSWLWHDEIHRTNVVELPISFPKTKTIRERIVRIVDELQSVNLQLTPLELGTIDQEERVQVLEEKLNEVIFDVFDLTASERDLVREMCAVGLDMFYRHQNSDALREVILPQQSSGLISELAPADRGFADYLRVFLDIWNKELAPDGEFAWRVLSPPSHAPLLAVSFTSLFKGNKLKGSTDSDKQTWANVLVHLRKNSQVHDDSSRIFIDTFFRYVSDSEIVFIKRNERRFWTRTAAREDAESTLTHLMNLEDVFRGGQG